MSEQPKRVQRKRTKGWRMPEGAVYVGRGSWLGNPFQVYEHCKGPDGDWGIRDVGRFGTPLGHGWGRDGAHRVAVDAYRQLFDEHFPAGSSVRFAALHDLAGRDLACWCPLSLPCHADVLLDLANEQHIETNPTPPATRGHNEPRGAASRRSK